MGGGNSKKTPAEREAIERSGLKSTKTEYRSYIFRRRRPSDASVETLLMDPVISTEFRIFVGAEFAESRLAFWHDVAAYQGISAQDPTQMHASALNLFDRYFSTEAASGELGLDACTIESIHEAFALAEKDGICVPQDVFNLAVGKVYEYIKSEMMPRFLISDQFKKIKTEPLCFQESGRVVEFDPDTSDEGKDSSVSGEEGKEAAFDASSSAVYLSSVFDIFPALGNPFGLSAFERFLTQSGEDDEAEDAIYVDFVFEVLDFKAATRTEADRMKRYSLIQSRYKTCEVGSIAEVLAQGGTGFGDGAVTFSKVLVAPNILDSSLGQVLQYLKDKHGEAFQQSWVASVTDLDRRVQRTLNNVHILDNFVQERNLEVALADIPEYTTLADLLDDSKARFYFKKYACRHFFEELVLFYMQADEYRKGNFISCKAGSSLYVSMSDDTESIMKKRARRLVLKFIDVGSPLQINISSEDRKRIKDRIEADDIDRQLFEKAQNQIKHMIEEGSRGIIHFYTEPEGQMLVSRKKMQNIKNSLKVTRKDGRASLTGGSSGSFKK